MTAASRSVSGHAIPGLLNIFLLLAAGAVAVWLLWAASHASSWLMLGATALCFSFINNTLFALLHESVHGQFHRHAIINDACGRLAAAFFPTSFSLQRVFHLGHHARNRSAVEQFDYLHPDDHRFFKYAQWYAILTGLYWCFVPLGCLAFLLAPWLLRRPLLRSRQSRLACQSSADAMFSDLEQAPGLRLRGEILFSAACQLALVFWLDLSWLGWCACYAAFGFNWSSLQYADHAWSPLDVRDGAWNLRVNRLVQYLFLNYHHHLAHHQHPEVPWMFLSRYVDFAAPRPRFLSIYLSMWRGPRQLPQYPCSKAEPPRYWQAEATALQFNLRFMRRQRRYLTVFLAIYGCSLGRWIALRPVRLTYALAQHLDDVLDGDWQVSGEPDDYVAAAIEQLGSAAYREDRLGHLLRSVAAMLTDLRSARDEPLPELIELLQIMRFDRHRVRGQLLSSSADLAAHHFQTFYHSVNLMLIAAQAELRAADAPDLVRAFGWCSTLRDLRQDLDRGLINIPRDVVAQARQQGACDLTYDALLATEAVRQWIRELHSDGKAWLDRCAGAERQWRARRGGWILRLFLRSMGGFHRRYRQAHPEIFAGFRETLPLAVGASE